MKGGSSLNRQRRKGDAHNHSNVSGPLKSLVTPFFQSIERFPPWVLLA